MPTDPHIVGSDFWKFRAHLCPQRFRGLPGRRAMLHGHGGLGRALAWTGTPCGGEGAWAGKEGQAHVLRHLDGAQVRVRDTGRINAASYSST